MLNITRVICVHKYNIAHPEPKGNHPVENFADLSLGIARINRSSNDFFF
jgi:hypothetical protein